MENKLAIIPRTLDESMTLAEQLAKSNLLPPALKSKPADVLVSIMAGAELGLPPMASIRGIYVVNGKPTLAADTMMGVVLASGLAEYFVQTESSATSVTFETKRKGSPVAQRCTWTMDDAKRAGVSRKDTWTSFPRQMLAARAKAELARSAYPDVLSGVYDPDELSVPVTRMSSHEPSEPIEDAEVVASPFIAAIEAATTLDELQALTTDPRVPEKGTPEHDAALAVYTRRRKEFDDGQVKA
jgi:hypothetical protein